MSNETAICDLNNEFGVFIQFLVALAVFVILFLKRFSEPLPYRRTLHIWFLDTSRQGSGALIIHFFNVVVSTLNGDNPCVWYFSFFIFDSTLGLVLIYLLFKLSLIVIRKYSLVILIPGNYGDGTKTRYTWWFYQSLHYAIVVFVSKWILLAFIQVTQPKKWSKNLIDVFTPLSMYPKLEVFIVMFLIPVILNAFMFCVVDCFIKKKSHGNYVEIPENNLEDQPIINNDD